MEFGFYLVIILIVSIGSFWFTGMVYGVFIHRPAIYFPLHLAVKMAICAVFGGLMFMIGGVVLATLVFNNEMAKRNDYKKWPTIIWGTIISILCSALIYLSVIYLAWKILG